MGIKYEGEIQMNNIRNGCQALYHEMNAPMCFVYGIPCIYKDRESCEKARELDIRLIHQFSQPRPSLLERGVEDDK